MTDEDLATKAPESDALDHSPFKGDSAVEESGPSMSVFQLFQPCQLHPKLMSVRSIALRIDQLV